MPDALLSACIFLVLLVPFAAAGLALINTGLNRSRSASHSILSSLSIAAVAFLIYFAWGFGFAGVSGGPAHAINVAGKAWDWLGAGPLFGAGIQFNGSSASLVLLFQLFTVGLASIIPVASGAERWRLAASFASTALFAGWTYPLFSHWVWGGGWLSQLGAAYDLGRGFVDPGGATCIHAVAGLTALSVAWILGPRRGKFTSDGLPAAMPGHNAVVVLFGCMLALVGWFGLNGAGSVLFAGATLAQLVLVAVNTTLSAASAGLAGLVVTRVRFGRPDASLSANGWVSGLVASSAISPFVKPAESVLAGFIAGALVIFAIEVVELRMKVDDPAGAISVHAVGGIWGALALGIFGPFASGQFLAQLIGIATLLGFMLPLTYTANWLLNRVLPQRVASEGERQGMDLFELGAGAYPEFVTHREDLFRR